MIYLPNRFYSRDDKASLEMMKEIFERESIFFIEKKENQRWLEEFTQMGPLTTNDPLKAMQFKTKMKAMIFMNENKIGDYNGWTITEHEFPEPCPPHQ